MNALLNLIIAEFELFEGLSILLYGGVIILIIIIFVVILLNRSRFDIKKQHKVKVNGSDHFDSGESNYSDKEMDSYYNRLINELSKTRVENHHLKEDIYFLKKENDNLKSTLKKFSDTHERSDNFPSSTPEQISPQYFDYSIQSERSDTAITKTSKINVSFSFEDKNGTVKCDDSSDMLLERINDEQFELKSEKEIYGTAIHLEQLQYNYKILNPDKANNKPMRVIKKPLYTFDNSVNKGFLIQKGEVEYQ